MFEIKYDKEALKHLYKLKNQTKLLQKVGQILVDISTNPFSPSHKFERLKGNFSGYCSKRLDKKNRVIYQVFENKVLVIIVSILGHYE